MGVEYIGKRIPKSGVTCKRCRKGGLEWVHLPYGKWGLVSKKTGEAHRCDVAPKKGTSP